jgi:hypothetical protein
VRRIAQLTAQKFARFAERAEHAPMSFEFPCPWCGCDTKVRGSESASWRFRIPCDLCNRDMIVTWDGGLIVGRAAQPLKRSDEDTVRIRLAKTG